uniref:Bis(5'-nucleosyl)-tetraphosphatase [asymmetrical] n=1 Tax=Cimex lectularius TaxID=79782 RepID=D1FPM5_CIMLE
MTLVKAAGLVICRHESGSWRYLLLQASYGDFHWTPPKGHVDPGEELLETAFRETEEEAGLKKDQLKLKDFKLMLNYSVKGKPKEVTYWLAEYTGQNPVILSREHKDYKWSSLDEALGYVKYDETKTLLKKCQEYLISNNEQSK